MRTLARSVLAGLQGHCEEGHPSAAVAFNQDLLGLQIKVSKAELFALR